MATILVIEDALSLREEILQMLELMEFQGIGAGDGLTGVNLAQQHLPDLIICDIMLPELDGYGVLQTLRRIPETTGIPFIFLTAKADRADIRQGMNLGADDYLTKPFTSEELGEAIAARLHKRATTIMPYVLEMKRAVAQIGQLAYQDPITGLANRITFQQQLQDAVRQAEQYQHSIGVLCVRLRYSQQGHRRLELSDRDALLRLIAERLMDCINQQDSVARLSEDEFSLLLPQLAGKEVMVEMAKTIRHSLAVPCCIDGRPINFQVSIGGTLYPSDRSPANELLHHAIAAADWGQKHSDVICQFYETEIEAAILTRQALEDSFQHALRTSVLQVYYQPQISIVTGRIVGAEALLRWKHPKLGWISPAVFVPIAEELQLDTDLNEWLFQTICEQVKVWQSTHVMPVRVSINLSAAQLQQVELVEQITRILNNADVSPEWLGLELTETTIMEDIQTSIAILQTLKQMGFYLSVDDFGTGYSSLNYLKRLPIDALKIDQSFIKNVVTDENDRAIVAAIIALAQRLNLRVVAEGVETDEQLTFLRRQGCHTAQGYLFSTAVSAQQFGEMLTSHEGASMSVHD
ncbi:MAG: hypothetical protein Kow00121_45330 [Elainellaceae cyanobacterium]